MDLRQVGALAVSGPGDIRVATIRTIPLLLRELGVQEQRAFSEAGVDRATFDDPEGRLPLDAVGRLLGVCAGLTGCPHFGLLVGERFELQDFGVLGYLLRNCPTVGAALRSLVRYLHLYDRAAAPVLAESATSPVLLGYSPYRHDLPAATQVFDGAIAIAHRILVELCGPGFRALRVQFSHGPPKDAAPYRRVFGTRVLFDAQSSAVVFAPSWMQRPIEHADPQTRDFLARAFRQAEETASLSFSEQVRSLLHRQALSGQFTARAVSEGLGLSERTVRRRLAQEAMSLQQLIDATRFELAQQLLRDTTLSVAEIGAALHYADPNVFARAFRRWAGVSPSLWRGRTSSGGFT